MFKCDNCDSIFETPSIYHTSYEEYYGVGHLFSNSTPLELEVCPCCGEDSFEEYKEEEEEEEIEQ